MNSTATVFIPELGMIEPRPCHEHFPMKPRMLKNFYNLKVVRSEGMWRIRNMIITNVWWHGEPSVLFNG